MSDETVLMVVVLYRANETSVRAVPRTLQCLDAVLAANAELLDSYRLLLWDNSPEAAQITLGIPFEYHHAAGNDGVSEAYNGALSICAQRGYEWLLLLDDDTDVTGNFLSGMLEYRRKCDGDGAIAAIAPRLVDKEFQLSPQRVLKHRAVPVAADTPRVLEDECFAANSGVMMRVEALRAIGGYSLDFWLDYSDIYVFHQIYSAKRRLYFAADLLLQHSMTMLDYDGRMTVARYQNFLYAEQAFCDLYKNATQQGVQLLRLCARVIHQLGYRNKAFSHLTFLFLLRRLTTFKKKRLRQWSERKTARHNLVGGA